MRIKMILGAAVIAGMIGAAVAGCAQTQTRGESEAISGTTAWTENCARCHGTRSPSEFSDVQWEVVTRHMELRGGIPRGEAEAIEEFLKSSN